MTYRAGLCQIVQVSLHKTGHLLRKAAFPLHFILLTACAPAPVIVYKQVAIPVPPLPHIPVLTEEQESSMRYDVYEAVENRDNAKTYALDQCRTVICSTHPDPKACFEEFSLK